MKFVVIYQRPSGEFYLEEPEYGFSVEAPEQLITAVLNGDRLVYFYENRDIR